MQWMMIVMAWTSTADVPAGLTVYEIPFQTEALCEAGRESVKADLPTRDVTVRTTCLRIVE